MPDRPLHRSRQSRRDGLPLRRSDGQTLRALYDRLLQFVEKPGRYVGGEHGSVTKDPHAVRLRFALAFPEVYEIAQSHLGLQILYGILNQREDIYCERAYAPWPDMERLLRERALPLASLETCSPLGEFHIVGFSLQYELTYTNVLAMLDLADIPLLAHERHARHPLVVAGGPCAFNPEPLAPFLDAVVLGDGEEAVLDIADAYLAWDGRRRSELLRQLATIPGVYVPSLFDPQYASDGRLVTITSTGPPKVSKRILGDLNSTPLPRKQIVPTSEVVHERAAVEVMRGCVKGCRFCQAGYIYRPLRERDPRTLVAHSETLLRESGYDELSLLSLSTGDYSCINPLVVELMNRNASKRIAVSLPSTRVDALDDRLLEEIRRVRKTGSTLAPEAGTQRLRDVIQKEYSEDDLLRAAGIIFELGWRSLKLYFMVGLPTETQDDLQGIVALARKVAAKGGRHRQITASVSTFVPKPHTPFQWAPQIDIAETHARQSFLRRELRRHRVHFKWHDARLSHLEGVFARGDRRLAFPLLTAYRMGCRFDGWTEQCRWDLWERAFADSGIDPSWYLRRRELNEGLPWDHLESGVSKKYLQHELTAAFAGASTPDCSTERCTDCGVCDFTSVRNITFHPRGARGSDSRGSAVDEWARQRTRDGLSWQTKGWARRSDSTPLDTPFCTDGELTSPHSAAPTVPRDTIVARVRLRYQKVGRARFLSNRALTTTFVRGCRRAGLPLAFSSGHHPQPRMSLGPALALGIASQGEFMDLDLIHAWSAGEIMAALSPQLPLGLHIIEVEPLSASAPTIESMLHAFRYHVSLQGLPPGRLSESEVVARVTAFDNTNTFLVERTDGTSTRMIDVRPTTSILQTEPMGLLLETRFTREATVKPQQLAAAILGLTPNEIPLLNMTKVATVFADGDGGQTATTIRGAK